MTGDPKVQKPRLPKSYTTDQLAFLKNHLTEYERLSAQGVRGDAKKFALARAEDFINRFGLPEDFAGVEEPQPRFREQIYNWFKNTVGRTKRKLEGRPRSAKKAAERAAQNELPWAETPSILQYQASRSSVDSPQSVSSVVQYAPLAQSTTVSVPVVPVTVSTVPSNQSMNLTITTLRDAFLSPSVDSATLSSMIQSYTMSNPSPIPLTATIQALFDAISIADSQPLSQTSSRVPFARDPSSILRRFLDACSYFPSTIVHAGVPGPLSGPRALQMQIRKYSIWIPNSVSLNQQLPSPSTPHQSSSITEEMQRIAADRQRRKDYIQWARVHAAALELGMLGMGHCGDPDSSGYAYAVGRSFSEMMARDSVWEQDEVEWVAGICVLRAVIRTGVRGDRRQRDVYDELLRTYEGRWKEIKDEARQALVTEILLGAKEDLLRFDEPHMA